MKKTKAFISLTLIISVIMCLTSCAESGKSNDKIKIIATLFPQYDFARQIAGDKADISLLLTPGTESHTYDPSAKDIYSINNCDLFLYTGKNMEAWADTVISGISNSETMVVDVSHGIELIKSAEHGDEQEEEHGESEEHEHAYDPHIWLNPLYASKMVDNILTALCHIDAENAEYYTKNAESYKQQLKELDSEFENTISSASGDTLVFGGRFAYIYFIERYNLNYESAYTSCSSETEPSLHRVYEIVSYIRDNRIPCVFKEELSEAKVAKSIAEQAGVECLTFSTGHNVSKEEFENGITFLDIMKSNLLNIKKALNY